MMLLASPWDRRHRRSSRPVCLYQPRWGSWGGGAQRRVVAVAVAVAVAADAAVVAATQRKKKNAQIAVGGKGRRAPLLASTTGAIYVLWGRLYARGVAALGGRADHGGGRLPHLRADFLALAAIGRGDHAAGERPGQRTIPPFYMPLCV